MKPKGRLTANKSLVFADSLGLEAMKSRSEPEFIPTRRWHRPTAIEGLIEADDTLLFPKFYMTEGLESWLRKTVRAWMETRPNWVNVSNATRQIESCRRQKFFS